MAFRKRPFMIVSELNGKVLDIKGAENRSGADVIMYKPKGTRQAQNQLWYIDDIGVIRSFMNDFALEAKGKGDKFETEPFNGLPRQQWIFDGNKIINRVHRDECLDIKGNDRSDGATVVAWNYKGSANQHWKMDHVGL